MMWLCLFLLGVMVVVFAEVIMSHAWRAGRGRRCDKHDGHSEKVKQLCLFNGAKDAPSQGVKELAK